MRNNYSRIWSLLLLLVTSIATNAQSVSGKIVDEMNQPLPGSAFLSKAQQQEHQPILMEFII